MYELKHITITSLRDLILESMLVTHVGPSQEGIEPTVPCNNTLTHYTLSYIEIMKLCSMGGD